MVKLKILKPLNDRNDSHTEEKCQSNFSLLEPRTVDLEKHSINLKKPNK